MSREAFAQPAPRTKPVGRALSASAERTLIAVVALLLLVPCFWQPHIMAGDLSSHFYNAWLAGQIERGTVPTGRLSLAHPLTNVLSDWFIEGLLYKVGRAAAERIIVGASVEIFFWGAFFFVAAVVGKRCWIIAPSLGMMAYGVIFHLGFLNFYISTGLSLWLMKLLWHPHRRWAWLAIPCAVLAFLAHPLPLAWAVAGLLYVQGVRRIPKSQRWVALLGGACLLLLIPAVLWSFFPTRWYFGSLIALDGITGAGQLWLYGPKYLIVVAGILIVWFILFLERLDRGSILEDPVVHLWGLTAMAYVLLPLEVQLPQYRLPLAFVQPRISLLIAVLFCAMVGGGLHGRSLTRASCLLMTAFFTMLYVDAKSLNQVEAELTRLVLSLPPSQRMVAVLEDSASARINGLAHVGSASCIGHCWDYGNYEPASMAFRVRVAGPNDVVVDDPAKVEEIQLGQHIVTAQEAPLYSVCASKSTPYRFELRRLAAGDTTCLVRIPATYHF